MCDAWCMMYDARWCMYMWWCAHNKSYSVVMQHSYRRRTEKPKDQREIENCSNNWIKIVLSVCTTQIHLSGKKKKKSHVWEEFTFIMFFFSGRKGFFRRTFTTTNTRFLIIDILPGTHKVSNECQDSASVYRPVTDVVGQGLLTSRTSYHNLGSSEGAPSK